MAEFFLTGSTGFYPRRRRYVIVATILGAYTMAFLGCARNAPALPETSTTVSITPVSDTDAGTPDTASAWMKRGAEMEAAGRFQKAADAYDSAASAYEKAGQNAEQAGAFEKKAQAFEKYASQVAAGEDPGPKPAPSQGVATHPTAPKPLRLPPLAPKPGWVIGRAVFEDGRPIPNFTVTLAGFDTNPNIQIIPGSIPTLGSAQGRNGYYAIRTTDTINHAKPVNGMVVDMRAIAKLPYGKETGYMDLYPLDGLHAGLHDKLSAGGFRALSGPGIVRDFVFKMHGLRPGKPTESNNVALYGSVMFGARVLVDCSQPTRAGTYGLQGTASPDSVVEVTLTPTGAAIDGSRPAPIVRRFKLGALYSDWHDKYLRELPIAPYSVTANITEPGGTAQPLRCNVQGFPHQDWVSPLPID